MLGRLLRWPILASALAFLLVAAPAALAGTWLTPGTTLTPNPASQPDGAIFDDGSAMAIWIEGGSVVYANRASGANWGPPTPLIASNPAQLDVATQENGRAAAVWRNSGTDVWMSVRSPSGTWESPRQVTTTSNTAPAVGVSESGETIVAYQGGTDVLARISPSTGTLGNPIPLASGVTAGSANPDVAMSANGTGMVVWRQAEQINSRARAAGSGTFESTQNLYADAAVPPDDPSVALSDSGLAIAAWRALDGVTPADQVLMSRRVGGSWTPPVPVDSQPPSATTPPQIVTNTDELGRADVSYAIGDGAARRVKAVGINSSGALFPADLGPGTSIDVAVNASGARVAVWIDPSGRAIGRFQQAGSGFEPAVEIAPPASTSPSAAINRDGDAMGLAAGSVIATGYDNSAPKLTGLDAPSKANVGEQETFSVTPTDDFRLTSSPVWTFGDGSRRTGKKVKYTYKRPGTFRMKVSFTDKAGFSTSLSRTIRVTRAPLAIRRAKWSGRYRESKLIRKPKAKNAYARLLGVVRKKTTVRIRLRRDVGGKPKGKVWAQRKKVVLRKGPIGKKADLKLPRNLPPGKYIIETIRRSGPSFAPIRRRINVRGPAEGTADRAFVSNKQLGKPKKTLRRPKVIWGNFRFSLVPRSKRPLTISWYRNGTLVAKAQKQTISGGWIRAERKSFLRTRNGVIPPGRYQARIRSGNKIIARANIRVR